MYPAILDYIKINASFITTLNLSHEYNLNQGEITNIIYALEQNTTIYNVNFTNVWLCDENVIALANILKKNTTITHLNLRSTGLNPTRITIIINALKENKTLVSLSLESNDKIGDLGISAIAQWLACNPSLIKLNLSFCGFTRLGLEDLMKGLKTNQTLQTLECEDNAFNNKHLTFEQLEHNTTLKHLSFSHTDISTQGVVTLMQALQKNQNLSTLSLQNNDLDFVAIQATVNLLENHPTLTKLNLAANSIASQGAEILAKALSVNTKLKVLNLHMTSLGKTGLTLIADAAYHHPALDTLILTCNSSGADNTLTLAKLLQHKTLTYLNFSNNSIGHTHLDQVSQALKHNTTLTKLFLCNTGLTSEAIGMLADALQVNTALSVCNLSANQLDQPAAKKLSDTLKINKTLTSLMLSNNKLDAESTSFFAEALMNNTTLCEIDLSRNMLGPAGTESIAQALIRNSSLKIIDLSKNKMGNIGAKALAEALSSNDTLTEIELEDNQIGEAEVCALAKAITTNQTITHLNLNDNNFNKDYKTHNTSKEAFMNALSNNFRLLRLSGLDYLPDIKDLLTRNRWPNDYFIKLLLQEMNSTNRLEQILRVLIQIKQRLSDLSSLQSSYVQMVYHKAMLHVNAQNIDDVKVQPSFYRIQLWLMQHDLNHPELQKCVASCVDKLQSKVDCPKAYQSNSYISIIEEVKRVLGPNVFSTIALAELLKHPALQSLTHQDNNQLVIETLFVTDKDLTLEKQLAQDLTILMNYLSKAFTTPQPNTSLEMKSASVTRQTAITFFTPSNNRLNNSEHSPQECYPMT